MTLRVGSLVYATNSGLGLLAKSFYDNGIITDPYIVKHAHHETHPEWFPGAPMTPIRKLDTEAIRKWLTGLDVFLALETPFEFSLFSTCREIGVKTALSVMHECTPKTLPTSPDLFICPSLLDLELVKDWGKAIFLPVPVDVPWRQRTRADVFVHNAGHGGLKGRNGTAELFEAIKYLKCDAKFIIRAQADFQVPLWVWERMVIQVRGEIRGKKLTGGIPYNELFAEGDVFIFPEKFNGLSLPLQEARAAGMYVMATDRFPMNTWLPKEGLIPPMASRLSSIGPAYCVFDEAILDPKAIAAAIDAAYGKDITRYSLDGKAWAETMSWEVLKPKYMHVLEELCSSSCGK